MYILQARPFAWSDRSYQMDNSGYPLQPCKQRLGFVCQLSDAMINALVRMVMCLKTDIRMTKSPFQFLLNGWCFKAGDAVESPGQFLTSCNVDAMASVKRILSAYPSSRSAFPMSKP